AVPALLLSSQWRTSVPILAGGAAVAVGGLLLVGTSHVLDVVGAVGTATYHQLNAQGNTLPELFARPLGSDAAAWVAAAPRVALTLLASFAWAVRLALAAAAPDRTPATAPRSMVTAHAR